MAGFSEGKKDERMEGLSEGKKDGSMERFFQDCLEVLVENLRTNETLDKLYSAKILTREEKEVINNLGTSGNVRILVGVLERKSLDHLETIIRVIENSTAGQEQHWKKLRQAQSKMFGTND